MSAALKTYLLAFLGFIVTGVSYGQSGPYQYYPLTPCRIVDTRNPVGPFGGPSLPSGSTRNLQAGGQCGVASDAIAVAVNVAVVAPAAGGYVTAYPGPAGSQR